MVTVGFIPGMGDAISKVGRKGFEVLSNSGIVKRIGKLLDADVVRNLVSQAGDLATPIVNGIKDAIVTKLSEIQDAARQLGDEVAQGFNNVIQDITGQPRLDRMAIETGPGGGQFDNTNQPGGNQNTPSTNTPGGRRSEIKPGDSKEIQRGITRENESADLLAANGYDVVQNPPTQPNGKNPDFLVNGNIYDNLAPTSSNIEQVRKGISKKVKAEQTERIIINLDDTQVNIDELKAILGRKPVSGLKNLIAIQDGKTIPFSL